MRGWEDLRWIATAAFLCWTVFIFLLLIIGLARKSKCCLFVFAAFGKKVSACLFLVERFKCNKALKTYFILSRLSHHHVGVMLDGGECLLGHRSRRCGFMRSTSW